jgi:hypothetical protein
MFAPVIFVCATVAFPSHSYLRVVLLSSYPPSTTIRFDLFVNSLVTACLYLKPQVSTLIRIIVFPL